MKKLQKVYYLLISLVHFTYKADISIYVSSVQLLEILFLKFLRFVYFKVKQST